MRSHLAIYGNVKIPRKYCHSCCSWAFVMDGSFQCCGKDVNEIDVRKIRRMSNPPSDRSGPSKKDRRRLLDLYHYKCAYCEQGFGWWVLYHGEKHKLRITWDHHIPWAFTQDGAAENFMPCCQFCNGWKSSFMFQTLIETKIYLQNKWQEERHGISEEESISKAT